MLGARFGALVGLFSVRSDGAHQRLAGGAREKGQHDCAVVHRECARAVRHMVSVWW